MKFASSIVCIAIASAKSTYGFAPSIRAKSATTTAAASLRDLATGNSVYTAARVRTPTELGLFGFSKAERFNSPAKTSGDISEKEVRALFELWNSALATGDSRIVASRYTKVRRRFNICNSLYDAVCFATAPKSNHIVWYTLIVTRPPRDCIRSATYRFWFRHGLLRCLFVEEASG